MKLSLGAPMTPQTQTDPDITQLLAKYRISERHGPSLHVSLVERLAHALARRFAHERIDMVLVPGTGAISLGYALSQHLGQVATRQIGCAFAMRAPVPGSALALSRGFPDIIRNKVVLVAQTTCTHNDLVRLANRHGAGAVVTMEPLVECLPTHARLDITMTRPDFIANMAERAEVCSNVEIDVVLVEAGDDIAVGHALALEVGGMQGRTPLLVYAEQTYTGALTVRHAPELPRGTPRVLVCDDTVATGTTLRQVAAIGANFGTVVGMATIWNAGTFRDPLLTSLVTRTQ